MECVRRKNVIAVIEQVKEEAECDHENFDLNTEKSAPKIDEHKECAQNFCNLSDEETMNARTLTLKDTTNEIVQDILPDEDHIEWDEIKSDGETWKKCIKVDEDAILNDFFMFFSLH